MQQARSEIITLTLTLTLTTNPNQVQQARSEIIEISERLKTLEAEKASTDAF